MGNGKCAGIRREGREGREGRMKVQKRRDDGGGGVVAAGGVAGRVITCVCVYVLCVFKDLARCG